MLQRAQGQACVRPLGRARSAPRRVRADDLRPELPVGAPAGRGGRAVRVGLFRPVHRRQRTAAGTRTATISTSSRNGCLPITDQSVPTLVQDLQARGLLDETLVVWMGEFGRSRQGAKYAEFGPDGRDHWPYCYTVLLAGGGVNPGAIHGSSDRIGAYPATLRSRPTTSPRRCSGRSGSTRQPR